ncbi:hypothetical protein L6164_016039 [Bauhinia variegata]|uniref:Uncharacterized protein n=1 Tax=Bauhinia variegata TaxID=167791 RepID=A0ACB9NNJ6_BAUVA|nr:hypothetical protein L6164_016039 [Bauhinia variegata]
MTIHNESRVPTILSFRLRSFDHGLTWFAMFVLLLQTSRPAAAQPPNMLSPPPPDPFSKLKFDKSMGIIMVVLVVVFFVLGFLSVYTRRCTQRRFPGRFDLTIPIGGSGRRSSRAERGLDPEIIETFPTFVYSTVKGLKIGRGILECAVCLNEFQDEETLRLIPKCNHVFHPDCIDIWLSSHSTCPVCRANLVPKPEDLSLEAIQLPDHSPETDRVRSQSELGQQSTETIEVVDNGNRDDESPKANFLNRSLTTNHNQNRNRPPRSRSTGFLFGNLFPRSHSTGHSLVQPGENCERYTLRLPEDVRNQLLNSTLNRTKSCVTFTRVSSDRRGYRTRSLGSWPGGNYLQNDRIGGEGRGNRWGFTLTPPFFGRTISTTSAKVSTGSNKPPSDCSGMAMDDVGERSSDRLWRGPAP